MAPHEQFNFGAQLRAQGAVAEPFNVTLNHVTRQAKVGKHETVNLIDDVSLYFKPGTMTLVLGAPGCGKTTLFKVLANHGAKKKKTQTGEVLFNGHPASKKTHHQSVAYVTQEDLHFPTLTVRETFQFSLDCRAPKDLPEQAKGERVDLLLNMLSIKHVENTLVGNDLIRGISGGQRKRVTIGVALTNNPSILLMDEPTTGLDANTALEVLSSVRTVCDELKTPVVAALLQPSPEICNLFDNLVILSKGRVAYFGSYKDALPYFAEHGLQGGKFQSDPEFLQEAVEFAHRYSNRTADQMVTIYRESPQYQHVMQELGPEIQIVPKKHESDEPAEHTYPTSFLTQLRLNLRREWLVTKRDIPALRARIMRKAVMAFIVGSLFFNLGSDQSGLRTRLAVLFFAILFLAFSNIGVIAPFYSERKVFYVQREQRYYSPNSFFLSKSLFELPFIIVECIIFSCILYWMAGLNSEGNRFVYFILITMVSSYFSITFCKCAGTFIAEEIVAAGLVPAIFGTMVMFTGFVIPPPSIPNWWIWIYYLSPFHYGLEGLMINELHSTSYHCKADQFQPPPYVPAYSLPYPAGFDNNAVCPITQGDQELRALSMHTEFGWRWAHLFIMLAFGVFFNIIMFVGGNYINHMHKMKSSKKQLKDAIMIEVAAEKKEALKKTGAYMSWDNLSYSVDVKKGRSKEELVLLDGITGCVRPGMLMALMGPSGAGKSTLLDVLANRKTGGHIKGEILINGQPRDKFFFRLSAYVEQQDMLMPLATVYETVLFSAQVRLPREMSKSEIDVRIRDTLHILDLEDIEAMRAGDLSMEQRKRLTIAVELVSDPQLLFLDEPTSGLDSQAAMKVMEVVKRIAETGRAVICTIHQPSLTVFSYFDHLLLLKRGGRTVYFGPTGKDCESVLEYFSVIGWECAPKRNPADFILDAAAVHHESSAGADEIEGKQQDPEAAYRASKLRVDMESHIKDLPAGYHAPSFKKQYASSFWRQLECNLRREWFNVLRRTQDLRARIMRSVMLGIIIGTVFLQLDHDQAGATSRFGLCFFVLIIQGTSANNAVPNVVDGRSVYYREQAAGAYRAIAYLCAIVIVEIPIILGTSLILSILTYWLAGLVASASHFFFFAWILFMYGLLSMAWVVFLSLALPSSEAAHALVGVFTSIFALFAGFIITKPNIPNYWIWMYYINFFHYPLEAIVVNEMKDTWFGCPKGKGAVNVFIPSANTTKEYCPITNGNQMIKGVAFRPGFKIDDMWIIIGMWIGVVALCYIALRYLRHLKR